MSSLEAESKEMEQTTNVEKETRKAIEQMTIQMDEISKVMDSIQVNTNNIDDEVVKCEQIINSTFDEIANALQARREALIHELRKTAKNKKLNLLLQHNELNNAFQVSQQTINETVESMQNNQVVDDDQKQIQALKKAVPTTPSTESLLSNNFDLHFSGNHSKQLIQVLCIFCFFCACDHVQRKHACKTCTNVYIYICIYINDAQYTHPKMIKHFGSISANPVPMLTSLSNNGKNFVVTVHWKLAWSYMASIDVSKTQKIRVEWSDAKQSQWNHKEFILSDEDKKQASERDVGQYNLINVGDNGTYLFRVRHFYMNKWSKMSNTKSIALSGISSDFWHPRYHGANVSIEGSCIVKKNESGYQSVLLSNVATAGVHEWRFKVEGGVKEIASARIFGIWKVSKHDDDDDENQSEEEVIAKAMNTYFTQESESGANQSVQAYGRPFGDKCNVGDIIDMYLDLNKLKLFYKLNDILYGKPVDIEPANYRAAISIYYQDDRIRLVAHKEHE